MWGVIVGSTWSPARNTPSSGSWRQKWSSVWPGVCTTNQSRPASRSTSPPDTGSEIGGTKERPPSQRATRQRMRILNDGRGGSPPQGVRPWRQGSRGRVGRRAPACSGGASAALGVALRREVVDGDLGLLVGGLGDAEAEAAVRDHARAGLLREARRAAEVVGMRVGDDHGVDVAHAQPGPREAGLERAPGRGPRQPRIHHRGAALVEERVAVHVAEARHADRQLHAEHRGRDLGHLLARRLLLLLARPRHGPGTASTPRRGAPGLSRARGAGRSAGSAREAGRPATC